MDNSRYRLSAFISALLAPFPSTYNTTTVKCSNLYLNRCTHDSTQPASVCLGQVQSASSIAVPVIMFMLPLALPFHIYLGGNSLSAYMLQGSGKN